MSTPIVEHVDADGEYPLPNGEPVAPYIAAEMSVLGAMLQSQEAIDEVTEILTEKDFDRLAHQAVWNAITTLRQRNEPTDAISVSAELDRRRELLKVGGVPYLHTLIRMAPTASANPRYYAGIVLNAANNRQLSVVGHHLQMLSSSGGDHDPAEVLERVSTEIAQMQDRIAPAERDSGTWVGIMGRVMDEAQDIADGNQKGIPTGFADLDAITNGLQPGHLTVFGARPGVGKSAILTDVARNVAFMQHKRVLFVSLEMSDTELGQRMVCAQGSIRIADYRAGRLSDDDWLRMTRTVESTADAPLDIERVASRNVWAVTALVRRYQRRYPDLSLVVIDYLQKLKSPDTSGKRSDNRVAEVGECSWALKELAFELDIPVVTAAQLNRSSVDKPDDPPRLNHLRESGDIEQDSEQVILIHRPDAEGTRDHPRQGEADFIVAKNRFGPQSTVTLGHQMQYGRFVGHAPEPEPSSPHAKGAQGSRGGVSMAATSRESSTCWGCRQPMTSQDSSAQEIKDRLHADCAKELNP